MPNMGKFKRIVLAITVLFFVTSTSLFVVYLLKSHSQRHLTFSTLDNYTIDYYPIINESINCVRTRRLEPSFTICIYDVDTDPVISGDIKRTGTWEADVMARIRDALEEYPDATLFDIGSNLGIHAFYAAALGKPVVAVEPWERHWPLLYQSIRKNNFEELVTFLPYALSDKREIVNMSGNDRNFGNAYITGPKQPPRSTTNLRVQTILWDDLKAALHTSVAIAKIDVETHECHVIRGGQQFLRDHYVPYIIMEYRFVTNRWVDKRCVAGMYSILEGLNYKPHKINGQPLDLTNNTIAKPINILWKRG